MPLLLRLCFMLPLLCLLLPAAHADSGPVQPVPVMDSLVVDPNGVLGYSQRHALNQKLLDYQKHKGSQIAVLIVSTTRPEDVFSYAFRVASAWKLGRAGVDDGVLMVIATDDHTDNIQVGYGLEGALPDIRAKQILQDTMAPFFRTADYSGGINAGVDAIISATSGERFLSFHRSGGWTSYVAGLLTGLGSALLLSLLMGRGAGGIAGGVIGGGVAFAMGSPVEFAFMIGGLIMLVVSPWVRLNSNGITFGSANSYDRGYRRGYNNRSWNNNNGMGNGGNNGNGGSSSGNNSSGGDGGSFGGGGASGNW